MVLKHNRSLFCRQYDLMLFSIVAGDYSSWQLVFQHRLSLPEVIWDVAFLTDRHLLVLQASQNQPAAVCTLSASGSSSVTVFAFVILDFSWLQHACSLRLIVV